MKHAFARFAALTAGLACVASAAADLTPYSQNFEGLNAGDTGALAADGWLVFGNVFDASNNYLYGYGSFGAPNDGAAFCQIASGEGGAAQGTQYLNVFSDYNNGDHANGNWIEANVFQEQRVGAGDLGKTFTFTFDYKAAAGGFGPGGDTTTFAFIKVLNPNNGWSLEAFPTIETTAASTTDWVNGAVIPVTIDSGWQDHVLQFGFLSRATHYEPSGVLYDNVNFAEAVPEPASLTVMALGAAALLRRRRRA